MTFRNAQRVWLGSSGMLIFLKLCRFSIWTVMLEIRAANAHSTQRSERLHLQIDPSKNRIEGDPIPVGISLSRIYAADDALWVADELAGSLIKVPYR